MLHIYMYILCSYHVTALYMWIPFSLHHLSKLVFHTQRYTWYPYWVSHWLGIVVQGKLLSTYIVHTTMKDGKSVTTLSRLYSDLSKGLKTSLPCGREQDFWSTQQKSSSLDQFKLFMFTNKPACHTGCQCFSIHDTPTSSIIDRYWEFSSNTPWNYVRHNCFGITKSTLPNILFHPYISIISLNHATYYMHSHKICQCSASNQP